MQVCVCVRQEKELYMHSHTHKAIYQYEKFYILFSHWIVFCGWYGPSDPFGLFGSKQNVQLFQFCLLVVVVERLPGRLTCWLCHFSNLRRNIRLKKRLLARPPLHCQCVCACLFSVCQRIATFHTYVVCVCVCSWRECVSSCHFVLYFSQHFST